MNELKPCPFCGLHVELVSAKTYPNGERSPAYIKCKRCNYHIAGYEDKDVINQWNTRSAIHKEFCPNCEAETPCTHEAELYACDICGEDFAKYIVLRNCTLPDVSMTQDVLTDIKTPSSIENTNPDYYKQELARIAELSQAVGLITTLKPTMVMDTEHPLDMAKEVVEYVTVRIAELEAEIDQLTAHDATERQNDKCSKQEPNVCEACGGDGTVVLRDGYGGQVIATAKCTYCNGTGRVNKEREE